MTRFHIEHHTRYRYDQNIDLNYGEARLLPRDTPSQRVLDSQLELDPPSDDYRERNDVWGNRVVWFMSQQPHPAQTVTARSLVQRKLATLPDASPAWDSVAARLLKPSGDAVAAREFSLESPMLAPQAAAADYAKASFPPGRPLLEAVAELTARIYADFEYRPYATQIDTPLAEVMRERHGVCQDFSHLALTGLRSLGLAARYVSGYLETTPAEGEQKQIGGGHSLEVGVTVTRLDDES